MEAVVSMIIIMSCFVMSTMIYLKVVKADNTSNKSLAFIEVGNLAAQSIHDVFYEEQDIKYDGFLIEKRLLPYPKDGDLKILSIVATDDSKRELYSFKQLVIVK